MPKCRECKFLIGYDNIADIFYCGATEDIEYIDPVWAEDDELGCDLYVNNRDDDVTKKP